MNRCLFLYAYDHADHEFVGNFKISTAVQKLSIFKK